MSNSICRSSVHSATGEGSGCNTQGRVCSRIHSIYAVAPASCPSEYSAARCLIEHSSATGRTSTTEPYSQTRTLFGDLDRFVFIRDRKIEITANRFLRFGKRAVGDGALFAGNNFAFHFQWITTDAFSLCLQLVEPGHPVRHHFLNLCRREPFVPDVATEKQQVIRFRCRCALIMVSFLSVYALTITPSRGGRRTKLVCPNGSVPGALSKFRVPLEYRTLREKRTDFNGDPVFQHWS